MTAPTLMPAAPAVSDPTRGTGPTPGAASGPGFASALDDALVGSDSPGQQPADTDDRTDTATTEPAVEHPVGRTGPRRTGPSDDAAEDSPETPAAPATIVQPGLWALLSAMQPLPGAAPGAGTAATSAAGLISAAAAAGADLAGASAGPGPTGAPLGPAPAGAAALGGPAASALPEPDVAAAAAPTSAVVPADPTSAVGSIGSVVLGASAGGGAPAAPQAGATPAVAPGDASATAPLLAPTAGDADTSGSPSDDSSSDRSGGGAPAPAPAAPDSPFFSMTTAATTVPVVQSADAAAPTAGSDPPVAAQLGPQLAVLTDAADGSHTMTLVITPDSLGPVSIQATVTDGRLDLTLHGAHEHGRHALAEALPDLRRELEASGLSVQRLEVGTDAGTSGGADPWARASQQQLGDAQGGQQRRPADSGRGPASVPGHHLGAGAAAHASDLSTSSGVDVRV